ncbi:hypothetical protein Tco_1481133 [Tanacetum coccineum]
MARVVPVVGYKRVIGLRDWAFLSAAIGGRSLTDIPALRGLGDGGVSADSSVSNASVSTAEGTGSTVGMDISQKDKNNAKRTKPSTGLKRA